MTYAKILYVLIQFLLVKANYSKSVMEPYIVGGVYTDILTYPHTVFLEMSCGSEFICGAAFINQRILLTAAHCIEECSIKGLHTVTAYAGNENIMEVQIVRSVKILLTHSRYDSEELINDIALGASEASFPLGDTMKRVIIQRSFPSTQAGSVAGWGLTDENSSNFSTLLKSVQQVIISRASCAKIGALHPGMFCAENESQPNHPTFGDSGSAFVTKQHQQLGIVSFRVASYRSRTVYTNVSYYYDWINANTRQMYCYNKIAKYILL